MVQLIMLAVAPTVLVAALYLVDTRTRFARLPYFARQIIWGVLFGCIVMFSMQIHVEYGDAGYTIRNSIILLCGLIFGGPTGIIAGTMTALGTLLFLDFNDYYFYYAMIAICFLAGVIAAVFRKYIFNNEIPAAQYGLILGPLQEILYLLLSMLAKKSEIRDAFYFIEFSEMIDILLHTAAITLALFVVSRLAKRKKKSEHMKKKSEHSEKKKHIMQIFQQMMLFFVIIIFVVAGIYTYVIQSALIQSDTKQQLTLSIQDIENDITDAINDDLIVLSDKIAKAIEDGREWHNEIVQSYLQELADAYEVAEINLVDKNGIIACSSNSDNIGYDMRDGEQSSEFMVLLDDMVKDDINGREAYAQSYQPVSNNPDISRKYCAVTMDDGGFLQVGYDTEQFQEDVDSRVSSLTRNKRIDEYGYILVCDENMKIKSSLYEDMLGKTIADIGIDFQPDKVKEMEEFERELGGESKAYMMYKMSEGYYIIAVRLAEEADLSRNMTVVIQISIEIIVCFAIFFAVFFIIRRYLVKDLEKVNDSLAEIADGNLDVVVDARGNQEFAELSDDINQTVDTLKKYIHEANIRIDKELAVAKRIQYQMLPADEVVIPDDGQFDLAGCMFTAKEVGGDFYDYFPVGENRVAVVIADVSGKGIPAALFMMTTKTLIKNLLLNGRNPAEALELANAELCANNSAKMFVTAWVGILDYEQDILTFANAGHNPPLFKKSSENEFTYLDFKKYKRSIMLGIRKKIKYYENKIRFSRNDILYLYTDGVTEAASTQNELFGEDRLKRCLDENADLEVGELLECVRSEVENFTGEAEQFDDITMVVLKMFSLNREMELEINTENQKKFAEFIEDVFDECRIAAKTKRQMLVCFDEIFSNAMKYSDAVTYKVMCGVHKNTAFIQMSDNGTPYNPLEQETPDVTKPRESYSKGGYGLVIIKRMTDKQVYNYQNNRNILTLYKEVTFEHE